MNALIKLSDMRREIVARGKEDGFTLVELLVFILIIGVLAAITIPAFVKYREDAGVYDEVESAPVEPSAPPIDFPIGTVLSVIVALFVVIAAGFFLFSWAISSKRKADHAKTVREGEWANNMEAWDRLFAQHDELIGQWAEYELNLEMLIRYPVLADVSHPKVQRLLTALQEASLARPQTADKNVYPIDGPYGKSVVELSSALTAAVNEAKKVAWKNFSFGERKRLNTAIQMLKMAQDAGASPHERQAAYKRVQIELDGLMVVPVKPMEVIEAAIRKVIEPAAIVV